MLGEVDRLGDVAVGARRDHEALLQPGEAGHGVRPRVEPVPGERELVALRGRQVEVELGEHVVERLAVEHVEHDPLALAAAHRLELRLVAPAPRVGHGLARQPERRRLAGDARAPVDAGAEDVEEERLQLWNCDSSVEPDSAVVSDSPPVIASATSSK